MSSNTHPRLVASSLLAARNLSFSYGQKPVLHGINLAVHPGEMVALLGRNGCGKSTLLRLLAGGLEPRDGTVLLDGKDLSSYSRRAAARLLAVASQELTIPFALSVRAIVDLGRTPYTRFLVSSSQEDLRAVDEALRATDLGTLADELFLHISGGEQQRTALAMALAQEPRVLLLDEPTVHLDIAHQMSVLALVKRLCAERGLAVVAAMHDINLTCLYADRLIVLAGGEILAEGTPHEVVTPQIIQRAFGARVAVTRHPTLDLPQTALLP